MVPHGTAVAEGRGRGEVRDVAAVRPPGLCGGELPPVMRVRVRELLVRILVIIIRHRLRRFRDHLFQRLLAPVPLERVLYEPGAPVGQAYDAELLLILEDAVLAGGILSASAAGGALAVAAVDERLAGLQEHSALVSDEARKAPLASVLLRGRDEATSQNRVGMIVSGSITL